ncbi:hypothetical protein CEUSTIGMA_g6541.t1 [Chlamydomonas eustigma]|uniref:Thioredoxin domain-containing protein n=1 Tax=Chlamydomonas eustigma TaxID=1157962 RepID=A0A250X7N6_9CHLO|nr:hypothetical protein CEUSTIGMA_g6541.t1 [Chlamydomonas eustigma]|eukprot:GAX79101.1 hypothetical protein CEUSTIGMA_g6541.t1 [Chlamydomonas eustigma]
MISVDCSVAALRNCVSAAFPANARLRLNSVSLAAQRKRISAVLPVAAQKKQFGSFDELLQGSSTPVLVDFYATWCGPCQMLAPVLSGLSKKLEGKLQVVKIDTDKYGTVASQFNVTALPTLILFKDGKPVDRIEGMLTEYQLMERLNYHIKSA